MLVAQSPAAKSGAIAIPNPRQGYEITEIAPGYYSLRFHANRNVLWVTSAGVIATDPGSIEQARVMREEIRRITPLPQSRRPGFPCSPGRVRPRRNIGGASSKR
jgi:hypothetical protein